MRTDENRRVTTEKNTKSNSKYGINYHRKKK